ncbi:MAG: GTPase Era [Myxococcota bacterium]
MSEHRAGVVAILGRPNAGKSTLLNRVLGQRLAIVTAKPQTTRSRILGIHSTPAAQLVLVDTPGLHASTKAFNQALNEQVLEAADGCDVALLLVDLGDAWGDDHRALVERLAQRGTPCIVAGNKCDVRRTPDAWPPPGVDEAYLVSAKTGEGVEALLDALVAKLPVSPPLYPEDELSDRPLRWLTAEEIRAAAFEALEQELPYALAAEVLAFDESRPDLVKIRAQLLVERESQKGIVIGRGGAMIKRIGVQARPAIEALVGTQVHLDLRVKVEPKWSKKPQRLRELGYA